MRYPRQERLQRTLMFEPQPRVSLPVAARQEHVSPSPAAGFDTRHEKTGGAAPLISIAPGCAPKRSHASVERSTRGQW